MTKLLLHTPNALVDSEIIERYDKLVCVTLSEDIVQIVKYLQKEKPSFSLQIDSAFRSYWEEESTLQFVVLPQKKATSPALRVAFYAQSDTLAHSTVKILKNWDNSIAWKLFTPIYNDEKAAAFFKKSNYEATVFSLRKLREFRPDYLLLFNDWTKEAKRIIALCSGLKIPVVCLQESIIDFGTKRRMQTADAAFVQGIRTVLDLQRKQYFLVGNPRYERNWQEPKTKKALLNSNFTYGIFEEWRERWLGTITKLLTQQNIPFFISQHPRDSGDLSSYAGQVIASSSSSVAEQLEQSAFTVTRFSSLIHESLLQYRPVIYYNPHAEELQYEFDFNTDFLFYATSPAELKKAIAELATFDSRAMKKNIDAYLTCHCLPMTMPTATNISTMLRSGKVKGKRFAFRDLARLVVYNPCILRPYFGLKKRLR